MSISNPDVFIINALNKSFTSGGYQQQVLEDLDVTLSANTFHGIAGPSGSGKSTLLAILSGLETQDSGDVKYLNTSLQSLTPEELAALRNTQFGFVFQSPYFVPYKSVLDNILLPSHYGDYDSEQMLEQAHQLAQSVGLDKHLHKSPHLLSGGEQQRMVFARAMLLSPKVIFADEPTASLDEANSLVLLELLKSAVSDGATVIMVSHDSDALEWADKVLMLKQRSVNEQVA